MIPNSGLEAFERTSIKIGSFLIGAIAMLISVSEKKINPKKNTDLPMVEIRDGNILMAEPSTIKKGPRNDEFKDTIHPVEVVPMFVPNKIIILSRKVIIPVSTRETVSVDTKVLD